MDYFAIDVGGTFIKYGLIDRAGNYQHGGKIPTPTERALFLAELFRLIEPSKAEIKGIGISLPGKIDTEKGIVYYGGALQFLHELPLKALVEKEFNIRCELANDGKAAALAELWLGNLKDVTNGAAVILGTGVGGGLIINGELYQGSHYQAGEFSFMISGQLFQGPEDVVGFSHSAVRFIKTACQLLNLTDETDGVSVFAELSRGTNPALQELFENYCEKIAMLIINLQATLDISTVVIGGGISQQDLLIQTIISRYRVLKVNFGVFADMLAPIQILPCHFRSQANLLGAVYHLLTKIEAEQLAD